MGWGGDQNHRDPQGLSESRQVAPPTSHQPLCPQLGSGPHGSQWTGLSTCHSLLFPPPLLRDIYSCMYRHAAMAGTIQVLRTDQDLLDLVAGADNTQAEACQQTVPLRHVLCCVGPDEGSGGDSSLSWMFPQKRVDEVRVWWCPCIPVGAWRGQGQGGPPLASVWGLPGAQAGLPPPRRGSSLLGQRSWGHGLC